MELTLGVHLHLVVGVGVHEGRVRIEHVQHAPDRAMNEFLLSDLVDVVALHQIEDAGEQAQVLIAGRCGHAGDGASNTTREDGDQDTGKEGQKKTNSVAAHVRTSPRCKAVPGATEGQEPLEFRTLQTSLPRSLIGASRPDSEPPLPVGSRNRAGGR